MSSCGRGSPRTASPAAVRRGVPQYILLGAGFDTFALRQPPWARLLRILEVDHAGTQATKRTQLAAAGLAVPENAAFATIDFEHESLRDGLLRYQVSLNEPAFFSWLGVTMYLKEEAIDAVLRTVAGFPAGSEIVLTFAVPPGQLPVAAGTASCKSWRALGELLRPDALGAKLRIGGFSNVEFLSPEEAEARYFRQRPQDLPVPTRTNIVRAVL